MFKFIYLFLIIFILKVKSDLESGEEENLKKLFQNLDFQSGQINCNLTNLEYYFNCIKISGENYVLSLKLNIKNSYTILASDIDKFSNMEQLSLTNASVSSDILKGDYKSLSSISFINPKNINNLFSSSVSSSITNIFIESELSIDFSEFSNSTNNSILNLNFKGKLSKPNSIINLTNFSVLETLILADVSNDFILNEEVPLNLPQTLKNFTLSGGKFSGSAAKNFLYNNSKIESLVFVHNSIESNFEEWINVDFKYLDISNNKFFGSVGASWCNTILIVSNNNLGGVLPSCFTCHMNNVTIYNWFKEGNQFTNISPFPVCSSLIPNLKKGINNDTLVLYGKDLGFSAENILIKDSSILFSNEGSIPSILFIANITGKILPKYFVLHFFSASGKYLVSLEKIAPIVDLITLSENKDILTLTFLGTYFNYNKSSINILVGKYQCNVTSAIFDSVKCWINKKLYNTEVSVPITINVDDYSEDKLMQLTTIVIAYLDQTTHIEKCQTLCGTGQLCNTIIGECITRCPKNCSGAGSCNLHFGECSCKENRLFSDCSGYECTSKCENDSPCDNSIGNCKCVTNYQGSNCTIPSQYITSVIPCSIKGGEVTLIGWFGNENDGTHTLTSYIVKVGSLFCGVTSINQTTIKCSLGEGTGTKNIIIINSNYPDAKFNGIGFFNYQNPIKSCPNSCTSQKNGNCNINNGDCQCNDQYTGFDCSELKLVTTPSTNSTIDTSGNATLTNQNTSYDISIIELNEMSFDGSIVISYPLNKNWSYVGKNLTDSNIFMFSQKLINNKGTINYTIEEVKIKDKSFTFGSTLFTVEKGSIKITILVKDYEYRSTLNTLQLVILLAAQPNSIKDCNYKESSIDTSNINNQQLSNYIQISKDSKKLIGRFLNQVISDSKITFMSSSIINNNENSSITLGLNLPHCNECLIDPDFSVLVSQDYKDSCDEYSNLKWILPVAVVVPVVCCAFIIIVACIVYRKNRIGIKIMNSKLRTLKKRKH
ncbi:hypothetical protein RB653_005513 [Dictyostelium firmibasis]|uniref:EGF-like domain-containing protein n=1 Tax=Dictyostelium firmibasis TaxID=79012 RepID=A0AAN7UL53_9MYCE